MPQSTPPSPPAPPAPGDQNIIRIRQNATSPMSVYEAATAHREEIIQQLDQLRSVRNRITSELTNDETRGVDRTGLEARLVAIDARIAEADKAMAAADANVAQAAAIPGAVAGVRARERAERQQEDAHVPQELPFVLGGIAIVAIGMPFSIAFARRIWRRGAAVVTSIPAELMERMARVEQGVESIAIEVERIGEGQRFMTRVITDANSGRVLGNAPAEPIRQQARDSVPVRSQETL